MSKAGAKFEEVHNRLMKDVEFKTEYERLKPRAVRIILHWILLRRLPAAWAKKFIFR